VKRLMRWKTKGIRLIRSGESGSDFYTLCDIILNFADGDADLLHAVPLPDGPMDAACAAGRSADVERDGGSRLPRRSPRIPVEICQDPGLQFGYKSGSPIDRTPALVLSDYRSYTVDILSDRRYTHVIQQTESDPALSGVWLPRALRQGGSPLLRGGKIPEDPVQPQQDEPLVVSVRPSDPGGPIPYFHPGEGSLEPAENCRYIRWGERDL